MTEHLKNEKLYHARIKRVMDVVALRKPDRVPIATMSDYFFVTSQGVNCKEAMYDPDKMKKAYTKSAGEYNLDMCGTPSSIFSGPLMDVMDVSAFSWPGATKESNRLPNNCTIQYQDKEYLMSDECDDFLKDPTDFTLRKLIPRMSSSLSDLSNIPISIRTMSMPYTILRLLPMMSLLLQDLGTKLKIAGGELERAQSAQNTLKADLKSIGYPTTYHFGIMSPFDWVADFLRGMKGTMLDMYRQPDKLKALVDVFEQTVTELIDAAIEMYQLDRVGIPLHWGAAGFMSDQQYAEFYWPQLKRLFLHLIEKNITPMPLYEGNYTPRLKYLAELPPGKIAGHYDTVDRQQHKDILSGITCFWGDVPKALLITGTTEQVKDYVKELIDDFPDGDLIIDGDASGIPVESKKENVMAMIETVDEYGKY